MIEFKHLEWDSSFFGFPVAAVYYTNDMDMNRVLKSLFESNYHLVYVFVPDQLGMLESNLLAKYKGLLADRKITYRYVLTKSQSKTFDDHIKINTITQINDNLIELAIIAGDYSRFKTDPNFGESHFRNLYIQWINKSVAGELADYVITYQIEGKPEGLVTLKIAKDIGKIILISVSDNIQGKGIGSSLINTVFTLCNNCGVKTIEVVTQENNMKACTFYKKNGFVKYKLEFIYHFWLKKHDSV